MSTTDLAAEEETVAYCPSCKDEVPKEEVGLDEDDVGEHTECGDDLWLSEDLVIEIAEKARNGFQP